MKICFTGRRPKYLCGYNRDAYKPFVKDLSELITETLLVNNEPCTFITGGAQGFDQLAFWAVDKIKRNNQNMNGLIHNKIVVPFKNQPDRWAKIGPFGRDEYEFMLSRADSIHVMHETIPHSVPKVLMDRNHVMVDESDLVIALYAQDDWQTASGGTAECMRYAQAHNKAILQIKYSFDENGNLKFNREDLVKINFESLRTRNPDFDISANYSDSELTSPT